MIIGIVCAMDKEFDLIRGCLDRKHSYSDDTFSAITGSGRKVIVSKGGIGKVNAALCAKKLIDYGVDTIISSGVAGAAESSINVGDIVVGNSYCYHDVWCGEHNMPGQVQGLPAVYPSSFVDWIDGIPKQNVHIGMIASGDWFVQGREKMEAIKSFLPKTHNVIAVDMESAAIAQVCYKEGVKFLAIRIISDNPMRPNQQEQYEGFWSDMAKKSFDVLYSIIK